MVKGALLGNFKLAEVVEELESLKAEEHPTQAWANALALGKLEFLIAKLKTVDKEAPIRVQKAAMAAEDEPVSELQQQLWHKLDVRSEVVAAMGAKLGQQQVEHDVALARELVQKQREEKDAVRQQGAMAEQVSELQQQLADVRAEATAAAQASMLAPQSAMAEQVSKLQQQLQILNEEHSKKLASKDTAQEKTADELHALRARLCEARNEADDLRQQVYEARNEADDLRQKVYEARNEADDFREQDGLALRARWLVAEEELQEARYEVAAMRQQAAQ